MWLLYSILASIAFAWCNIMDSILVHSYKKNSFFLSWCIGALRVILLVFLFATLDLQTSYAAHLVGLGVLSYGCFITYFYVLKYIDTSVTQSAWAIESIMLSILGFYFFHEEWTLFQTVGSLGILIGVFILSYWHVHISLLRTLSLLLLLAIAGAPIEFGLKLALEADISYLAVISWYWVGSSSISLIFPLLRKSLRRDVIENIQTLPISFWVIMALTVILAFLGLLMTVAAYASGPLSLVAIANNAQPFFVIFFAWLLLKMTTLYVPKELLTAQSVYVKIVSFAFVLGGLSLLSA